MLTKYLETDAEYTKYLKIACSKMTSVKPIAEYQQGSYVGCFKQLKADTSFKDVDEFETYSIQVSNHPILQYNGLYEKVANNPLTFKNFK